MAFFWLPQSCFGRDAPGYESHTKTNAAALKQLSSCMIRIIRNDTGDEREELPGCELAGKMWKCGFPGSRAVVFLEKFCPSPQPEGSEAGLWGQGVQLPSCQDCCCSAGCQFRVSVLWELLSRQTHPNSRVCLAPGKEVGELRSEVSALGPGCPQG